MGADVKVPCREEIREAQARNQDYTSNGNKWT